MYDNSRTYSYILDPIPEIKYFTIIHGNSAIRRRCAPKDNESLLRDTKALFHILHSKGVEYKRLLGLIDEVYAPSRIVVHHHGGLDLPNLNNAHIRLTPMERTLYIFFLQNPNGFRASELWEHYNELCKLYFLESTRSSREAKEKAIDSLCDDCHDTFFTIISRIKGKIARELGPSWVETYAITKDDDGIYRILVPRSLVSIK